MYDKGRHDSHTRAHQAARYHLRAGIAHEALKVKLTGETAVDCVGRPLQYANEMADRHSVKTLQKWADGRKPVLGVFSGMDFRCGKCRNLTKNCRCRP